MILHGVLVAMLDRQRWRGVLVVGPSGAGKSDLAFRLMELGFQLVADDQVVIWISEGKAYGRAPEALSGLVEARGYGIVPVMVRGFSAIDLVVDIDPEHEIDRMPEPAAYELHGVAVPLARQRARESSAPAKIRRWLMALG